MSEGATIRDLKSLPGGRIKAIAPIQHPDLSFGIGALEIDVEGGRFRLCGTKEEWQMVLNACKHLVKTTPRAPEGIKPPVNR